MTQDIPLNPMIIPETVRLRAAEIRLMIFDVDGILTNGQLIFSDKGIESKAFHAQDGLGCQFLLHSGVEVALITGRSSKIVSQRAERLGIRHVYQGQMDKRTAYEELKDALSLSDAQCAFAGDDLIDLPVLVRCGLAMSVPQAHPAVLEHVHWVSSRNAGDGAARQMTDLLMSAQGTLAPLVQSYLT